MVERPLNADAGFVEVKLDLPVAKANLFKFNPNEELEFRPIWKRVHLACIANGRGTGNVRFPPIAVIPAAPPDRLLAPSSGEDLRQIFDPCAALFRHSALADQPVAAVVGGDRQRLG